ncbi:MAG: hypothetical protein VX519_03910 [Myxococcota bacterium]|nr:hypothetical protein [Myxococcota bacterium]
MFLTLLCAMSWAVEPGVGLGARGVRGSDGLHRLQPAVSAWARQDIGAQGVFLQGELLASYQSDRVVGGHMRQGIISPALMVGSSAGQETLRVHAAVGPAGFFYLGGLDSDQWLVRPGVRALWGLEYRFGDALWVGGSMGGAFRGEGGDVDVLMRLGRWP